MERNGLEVAYQKTEAVMLSGRKKHGEICFTSRELKVTAGSSVKYLGVILDNHQSLRAHVAMVIIKAEKNSLIPSMGGAGESSRRLLGAVGESILLYGAEIWIGAMGPKSTGRT
ncbi:hypothetical protein Zmor_021882 [Zophobas morio]|uniref:Uncharacterized protein n=1 Tax=Zophobas morio TaxID=2755281 RepID=A0AA38I681_9CUCU|nr:hypothetical protein Zmor_021882 [Zophobas morio]